MITAEKCAGDLSTLPKELVDFARRQVVNAKLYKGDEQRRETRYPMMVPVHAVRVDQEHHPIDEPFDMITRDISASAIGLIHTEPVEGDRFAIHFSIADTEVDLLIATIWSGTMGPFYGAAGRFLERLDHFPADSESTRPTW